MSKYTYIEYLSYKSKLINCKEDNSSETIDRSCKEPYPCPQRVHSVMRAMDKSLNYKANSKYSEERNREHGLREKRSCLTC